MKPAASPITEIVLIRHGETAWNAEGRIQGHLDIPLNETGVAQAAAVGARLGGGRFDSICSSDLGRALQTAQPVARFTALAVARDARLRERNLGVLQGLTGEEAMAAHPQAWAAFKARRPDEALEGGESLSVFTRRVVGIFSELAALHAGGRVIVVTHGGVLDAIYRHATAMALDTPRDFPIYNASVNVIRRSGGRWEIGSWGDVSHLPKELAMDDT